MPPASAVSAAKKGDLKTLRVYLAGGGHVVTDDDVVTLVAAAAAAGQWEAVALLADDRIALGGRITAKLGEAQLCTGGANDDGDTGSSISDADDDHAEGDQDWDGDTDDDDVPAADTSPDADTEVRFSGAAVIASRAGADPDDADVTTRGGPTGGDSCGATAGILAALALTPAPVPDSEPRSSVSGGEGGILDLLSEQQQPDAVENAVKV